MKSPSGIATALITLSALTVPSPALAQQRYLAIDMVQTDLSAETAAGAVPQLIGDSPLMLVQQEPGIWFVRAKTVDKITGEQLGSTLDILFPPGPCAPPSPCDLLYSHYFLPGAVFVLSEDFSFVAFPLTFNGDGTPVAGSIVCSAPDPALAGLGTACGLTEMPGWAFGDGKPRLFVGSASGNIAMFLPPDASAPILEDVIDLLAGQPISALAPIPLGTELLLGAATGAEIVGIIDPDIMPAIQFGIIDPEIRPIRDFVAQNPGPPTDPTYIAFCTGVNNRVPCAYVWPNKSGTSTMALWSPGRIIEGLLTEPPVGLALGSLLLLTQSGNDVYYDPGYDILNGSSACLSDMSFPDVRSCEDCFIAAGDINETGTITSQDIVLLVNYTFKAGPAPTPCIANGDVNCTGSVTSADIISLVNFVFKGATPPCNPCAEVSHVWPCE